MVTSFLRLSPGLAREWVTNETYVLTIPNWGVGSDHRPIVATFEAGEKQRHTELDAARGMAEGAARELASGAEGITREAADLQGGGFVLQASHAPVGVMPQVLNLSASGGDFEGTVDLHWDPRKRGLVAYLGERALLPDGPWTQFYVGSDSKCTAAGLTSGTAY